MKRKEILWSCVISLLLVVVTVGICEVALRIKHQKLSWKNFVEENWNLASLEFPIQHDSQLGWIPKENFSNQGLPAKDKITLLALGVRSNGQTNDRGNQNSSTVLTVGASTVFGSQVSDEQTWPAILEEVSGHRVINAGVFAYGFDQVILRLEQMVPQFNPQWVILGIHPDNLSQVTMSQKYGKKPYFDISENKLILKNTPVPMTKKELAPYQAVLGYSYLAHYLLSKLRPEFWLEGHGEIKVHDRETEVNCLLAKRLENTCSEKHLNCALVFQYFQTTAPEARNRVVNLKSCFVKGSVSILDTYEPLELIRTQNPKLYESYFNFHMTSEGNAWTANYIQEKLNLKINSQLN